MEFLRKAIRGLSQYLQAIAGVPNYEAYVAHLKEHHPDETPMCEKEFHRTRNDEKYGGGSIRRCC